MNTASDFWIVHPFSTVFCLMLLFFVLLLTVGALALRGRPEKLRQGVLICACLVTLAGYFLYKHMLSLDADYNVITAAMGGFNWWGELPLQLCNINMILIPIAVWRKSRPLMCFSFFLGPLGAAMALVMPGNGFDGYSLLLPRMLGYYGTHFMIVIEGLAIVCFGLYRPKFRDLPRTVLAALLITLVIFGINMLLRWSGLHPKANYFFSVETEGNFLLEIFYKWIPVPFLYLMPAVLILTPYMALITAPFAIADHMKAKREKSTVGV